MSVQFTLDRTADVVDALMAMNAQVLPSMTSRDHAAWVMNVLAHEVVVIVKIPEGRRRGRAVIGHELPADVILVHIGVAEVQGQAAAIVERLGKAAKDDPLKAFFEHAVPVLTREFGAEAVGQILVQLAGGLAADRRPPLAVQIKAERAALAAIRQA
ncbi:hypothetical protein [Roseovarius sp. D0-M9]|uniref:hypothetical protein n=1 Tax=Roseovarius sp. D0-M9 TaxID=3127117 RepID=UPI0030104061